jgi:hypothetical protein
MPKKRIYRVIFQSQGRLYEVYANAVHQSGMYAFVEVEELLFGEKSSLLVDPSEEHLKSEFNGVTRTFIPIHAIIRIDEMDRQGHGKITPLTGDGKNVTPFPVFMHNEPQKT